MRLEDMTPALVRRAIAIYLEKAWPTKQAPGPKFDVRKLEDAGTLGELFAHFERPRASDGEVLQRHTLRLGNERYPFMKFVVQEYLVDEEYFFSVDTHDDLDVRSDSPDYFAWLELKAQNQRLKREIESAWAREGLPTNEDLRLIAQGIAQVEREETKPARLLVVDDESQVAQGVAALLEARGYQVEIAYDGKEVLERLERDPLPDLILLDYGMPEVGGEQVLQKVRENPRRRTCPCSSRPASSIALESRAARVGLPARSRTRASVLFAMLERLLRPAETR
jgi:CheY-like chemotaxis protein